MLGAVLILAAVVAAQDSTNAQRLAFERELRAVEARIQVLDWERGKRDLEALLNEHRERDYVRARRDHIAELMKKCVFRLSHPEPRACEGCRSEAFRPPADAIRPRRLRRWQRWCRCRGYC